MNLNFIFDTQLPPILAERLNEKGHDAIHATHFKNGHFLNDTQIREIATREERIVITKDKDFLDYFLIKGAPPNVLVD